MPDLFASSELERYLKTVVGSSARILKQSVLGKPGKGELKEYGYGTPLLLEYELHGQRRRAVLHTVRPGPFGHEHMSDRAQSLLWDHGAFNTLPRHVRSIDVAAFKRDGTAVSLGEATEFFTLTDYGEGEPYANDLERILESGELKHSDFERTDALCDYLVEIHSVKNPDHGLYIRRIRELIGHSECIMGLVDSYPPELDPTYRERLLTVEKRSVEWRWKIKDRVHRLRQVHGDFHPWNILFGNAAEFCLLDRSRGEWGDPADDVTCLTMNYFFFSLQRHGHLTGSFEKLFMRFWDRYLERSGDREILQVAAPFIVFRSLVLANPVWYPRLTEELRKKLFQFMSGVLGAESFDPGKVNDYCSA